MNGNLICLDVPKYLNRSALSKYLLPIFTLWRKQNCIFKIQFTNFVLRSVKHHYMTYRGDEVQAPCILNGGNCWTQPQPSVRTAVCHTLHPTAMSHTQTDFLSHTFLTLPLPWTAYTTVGLTALTRAVPPWCTLQHAVTVTMLRYSWRH
jgi:hypothetical protein